MDISHVKKGLVVECDQGVGTIMSIDYELEMVLLSKQESSKDNNSNSQITVAFDEIQEDSQSHPGCEEYY
ncbi:hypothetical protein L0B53_00815 [Vibrio sp. SS-MA-C1-2]|uniref:hypothetical protein n=1 Tax=Vibrio sp. SS-MA-C1-2 TaxID=2908646 RepID=UPI001F1F8FCD|nr:hypothetical protein [Vibrio sp. SS-MA-C1-2]UJF17352.1 hypothetical protein L0B53_00815 [Vibrio sp. SS-MA-C1-2]